MSGRNIGVREGLVDQAHRGRMGPARHLFDWLVLRQTRRNGLVLAGCPVKYAQIQAETGYPLRTLKRWMLRLTDEGYVARRRTPYGQTLTVLKAKKFQKISTVSSTREVPKVARTKKREKENLKHYVEAGPVEAVEKQENTAATATHTDLGAEKFTPRARVYNPVKNFAPEPAARAP